MELALLEKYKHLEKPKHITNETYLKAKEIVDYTGEKNIGIILRMVAKDKNRADRAFQAVKEGTKIRCKPAYFKSLYKKG